MKIFPIYMATYFCYLSNAHLLATYAFCKNFIMVEFNVSTTYLGIIDVFSTFCGLISFIVYLKYPFVGNDLVLSSCFVTILGSVGYSIIIIFSNYDSDFSSEYVLWLYGLIFGLSKSLPWPLLMNVLSRSIKTYKSYNIQKSQRQSQMANQSLFLSHQSTFLTAWTSTFNIGCISGFLSSSFIVYQLHLNWKISIIFGIFISVVSTVILYKIGNQNDLQQQQNQKEKSNQAQNYIHKTAISRLQFCKLCLSDKISLLTIIVAVCIDSVSFGMHSVLPAYFYEIGYKGQQGALSSIYSGFIFLGMIMLNFIDKFIKGIIQESKQKQLTRADSSQIQIRRQQTQSQSFTQNLRNVNSFLKIIASLTLVLVNLIILALIYYTNGLSFQNQTYQIMICFIASIGLLLGPSISSYLSFEMLQAGKRLQRKFYKECHYQQIVVYVEQIATTVINQTNHKNQNISDIVYVVFMFLVNGILMVYLILAHFMIEHCKYLFKAIDSEKFFIILFVFCFLALVCDIIRKLFLEKNQIKINSK